MRLTVSGKAMLQRFQKTPASHPSRPLRAGEAGYSRPKSPARAL